MSSVLLSHPPQTLFIRLWGQKKTLTGACDLARYQLALRIAPVFLFYSKLQLFMGKIAKLLEYNQSYQLLIRDW